MKRLNMNIEKGTSTKNINIDLSKSYEDNINVYCPLSYQEYIEPSTTNMELNGSFRDYDNTKLGYVSKFIVDYDKEYQYE